MIIRQLMTRLHSLLMERRAAARFQFCIPVTITIAPEKNPNANLCRQKVFSTDGVTKDLSENGIAFSVSSIRLDEHYLVGEEQVLLAKLDSPDGEIQMKIIGVRYERERVDDEGSDKTKYLIGARIIEIEAADREIYQRFLRHKGIAEKVPIQDFTAEIPES